MKDLWMKDGVPFRNPLIVGDRAIYNPTPEELTAAGYSIYVPPAPEPEPEPDPEPQTVYTKLKIRRAMRALEIEGKLDNLLAASPTFARDWADAQEIDLADPVLVEALDAGSVTRAEIAAIRRVIENGGVVPEQEPEAEAEA